MKILIVTGIYPPSIGGPATYSKLLMDELPKRGIETKVISYDEVRKYPRGLSHLVLILKIIIRGFSSDFLYAQDPVSVGWPTMWACRILRKKYLLKIVGDFAWEQGVRRFGVTDSLDVFVDKRSYKKGDYKSDVFRLKKVEKTVAENAEKIIVPSQYLKNIVIKWGIRPDKISVIYNAFLDLDFEMSKREARDQLDYEGQIILSVGRLVPWKGFDTLISMMSDLIAKFPNAKLFIIGDGPQKRQLETIIQERGLGEYVFLIGALTKENLYHYIKASDVFVLNTNYEGFSHQLLEVMAIGTPIVTTNVGGNPELVDDEKDGLLVNYNDKKDLEQSIEKLLMNDYLGDELTSNAKEKVKKYNKEDMLKRLISEFEKIA